MNKFNEAIIVRFRSVDNCTDLYNSLVRALIQHPKRDDAFAVLHRGFHPMLEIFAKTKGRAMMYSGTIIVDSTEKVVAGVRCLNAAFFDHMIAAIEHELGRMETPALSSIEVLGDGSATSTSTQYHWQRLDERDTSAVDDPQQHHSELFDGHVSTVKPKVKVLSGMTPGYRVSATLSYAQRNETGPHAEIAAKARADTAARLESQRYARRGICARDDPVSKLASGAPCSKHCLNTADCPGCSFNKATAPTVTPVADRYDPVYVEAGGQDQFTGRDPEPSQLHERFLNNRFVQSLNQSNRMMAEGSGSAFRRGTTESVVGIAGTDTKLWKTGGGFVDESNAAEMQRLNATRVFRSTTKARGPCAACNAGHCGQHSVAERVMLAKFGTTDGSYDPNFENASDDVTNQISIVQRGMHRRQYDRQSESIGGFENGCLVRGYGNDARQELLARTAGTSIVSPKK